MKKYFYAALIAGTILAGTSSLTVQAMKPATEQVAKSEKQTIDQTTTTNPTEEHLAAPSDDDDDKTAEPAAAVSDSTTEETAPETVDMTISPELQKQTLEKFANLSCNLEPIKEFNRVSQLHSNEKFQHPDTNPALKALTLYCAPNPEYMPKIEGLPIISTTGVPFINASCVPTIHDCRYILAANPVKGWLQVGARHIYMNTYPEYIKLLLHYRPKFLISLASKITDDDLYTDPERYCDDQFTIARTNFEEQNAIINKAQIQIYERDNTRPSLELNKFYVLCKEGNNPASSQAIVDLILQIKHGNPADTPIVIQSRSGNGRPACLATILLAYDEMTKTDSTPVKSIPEILSDLSQIRCCTEPYFSKEQYLLIYNVVNKLAKQIPYTPAVHNFLTHHNLDAPSDAQTSCVICWKDFTDDDLDDRRIFPNCGHFYHRSCCKLPNGKKIMSCPLCRSVY